MRALPAFALGILLLLTPYARAAPELRVPVRSEQLRATMDLGSLDVEGVGRVRLEVRRTGRRVVIKASGPQGKVLGRAETVVGLRQTPIFILTPDGLKKILIYWGQTD